MGRYFLKTKKGVVINTVNVDSFDDAITYFAKHKKISEKDLLKIYKVEV